MFCGSMDMPLIGGDARQVIVMSSNDHKDMHFLLYWLWQSVLGFGHPNEVPHRDTGAPGHPLPIVAVVTDTFEAHIVTEIDKDGNRQSQPIPLLLALEMADAKIAQTGVGIGRHSKCLPALPRYLHEAIMEAYLEKTKSFLIKNRRKHRDEPDLFKAGIEPLGAAINYFVYRIGYFTDRQPNGMPMWGYGNKQVAQSYTLPSMIEKHGYAAYLCPTLKQVNTIEVLTQHEEEELFGEGSE